MLNRGFLLIYLCFFTAFQLVAQNHDGFFNKTDAFMNQYVIKDKINYVQLKNSPSTLKELVEYIGQADISKDDLITQKAFQINAYNILVINTVVENYPINSPMEISGFFDTQKHLVNGENITLDHFENKVMRPTYKDPRLHFVLVCGALGCPPIVNKAYFPSMLEEQLDAQTKKAVNGTFLQIDNIGRTVALSEICKWYKVDFVMDGNELDFINKYRDEKIPNDYKITYFNYNWNLNDASVQLKREEGQPFDTSLGLDMQTYTPGTLLKKGQIDITLFNSIYTQTESNWMGTNYSGFRETFYSTLFQFTLGTSKNARINLGVDVNFRATARSSDSTMSSVTAPFGFQNNDSMRVGVTSIGPRIKLSPFKGNNNFSLQSTVLIPTIEHPEGFSNPDGSGTGNLYWADWNRYIWWNQFFYTHSFGQKFQLFTEADLLFRFRRNTDQATFLDLPVSAFFSYFPTKKITLYAMSQHVPRLVYDINSQVSNDWVAPANYTTVGAGFKYQVTKKMNIELLYTNFVDGVNTGLGETYNLGLKFIR